MKLLSRTVLSECICLALFLATGIAVLIGASQLPEPMFDPLGPAGLPRYIGWLIVALTFLRGALFLRAHAPNKELPNTETENAKTPGYSNFFVAVAITLGYLLALTIGGLPFVYLTLAFLCALGVTLSDRKTKSLVIVGLIAIAGSFGLSYLFTDVLNIILPE